MVTGPSGRKSATLSDGSIPEQVLKLSATSVSVYPNPTAAPSPDTIPVKVPQKTCLWVHLFFLSSLFIRFGGFRLFGHNSLLIAGCG